MLARCQSDAGRSLAVGRLRDGGYWAVVAEVGAKFLDGDLLVGLDDLVVPSYRVPDTLCEFGVL